MIQSRRFKSMMWSIGGALVLMVALLGCQTTKPALVAPTDSMIQAESSGFSPANAAGLNSIDISLLYGNRDMIKSWKVAIMNSGMVSKTWSGDAASLPSTLTWDGKNDVGAAARDGAYTAKLFVDYKEMFLSSTAESRSFVLDVTPPAGSITSDPSGFTPTASGVTGPVTLTITASAPLASMDSWSLDVLDPSGELVQSWSGLWPDTSITWDGSSMGGGFVNPAMTYKAVATVRDEYGNSSLLKSDIEVAGLPITVPTTPGHPAIVAVTKGFSPNGDQVADKISLVLGFGQETAVTAWKVTISSPGWKDQRTFTGDRAHLPSSLSWDGKSDSGAAAPEGTYTAGLAVDYGTAFTSGAATSASFVLAITPPTGSIALSSPLFSPMEASDRISMKLSASSKLAKIDSWVMNIYDPNGNFFRSFVGKWPAQTAVWDGKSARGDMVQSAEDYIVVAKIRDQFGNVGFANVTVPVDILVEKIGNGYRILASRIFFKAFTADYKDVPAALAKQNVVRLDALAAKLEKFGTYKIRIVGHAVMVYWDRPAAGAEEQRSVLLPLSKARAEAMKSALVARGIKASRSSTEGVGASDQLVPDSNLKDRWQNRRVAFFLD